MDLDDLFLKAQELPTIPEVVQELIQSFDNDDFDVDDIAKKVGMDQVLTAKVMRLANSAKYGGNRTISSVNEAVVRMGFNALRTLVLASGFTSAFKAPEGFDLNQFWRDSFGVAELSRWLAGRSAAEAETAFTCGMLSNIGRLMVHLMLPEKAQEIERVVEKGGNRLELERDAWGFTSDEAGARVAKMWKFPASIVDGISHQSEPLAGEGDQLLACLNHLASHLYVAQQGGASDEEIIEGFPNDVAKAGGVDLSAVMDGLAECRELDSGIDSLLD